ncbi:MAG: hypothetical protein IJ060_04440 [Oscillospiraceae bacterium]|nr:hypothetical protein [Oscillospiraceae bacterium]
MELKKMICVLSACSLAALSGCGEKSNTPGETPAIEEVTGEVSEIETTTEATTLTETTTFADTTELTTETTADAGAPVTSDTDESLTLGLQKQIEEWSNGCVRMRIHCEQVDTGEDMNLDSFIDMDIYTYQKNSYLYMNMFGFEMKTIFDGSYTYQLDEATKTYCKKQTDEMEESDMAADNALDEVDATGYVGKGREDLNGVQTLYEEFQMQDDEGEDENVKFYYDDAGNLIGCKVTDSLGEEVFFDYTITFTDTADMSVFAVPAGYTEVSEEDLATNLVTSMFAAIGQLMEDAGLNE